MLSTIKFRLFPLKNRKTEEPAPLATNLVFWMKKNWNGPPQTGSVWQLCWPYLFCTFFWKARFTIRADHEGLWLILYMAEVTTTSPLWRLRLFKFEVDIVRRTGLKHQLPDAQSWLKTKGVEKPLGHEVPVHTVSQECFACDPHTREVLFSTKDFKTWFFEEKKFRAKITDKLDVYNLRMFSTAHFETKHSAIINTLNRVDVGPERHSGHYFLV